MSQTFFFRGIVLFFFLILGWQFPPACSGTTIEGIVFSRQGPVQDAVVHAFRSYSDLLARQNAYISQKKEHPGQYRLDIPPGKYFFIATGQQDSQELFSYHGGNPITISTYQWLPFFTLTTSHPACETGPPGIGGQVTYRGKPLSNGTVSVYSLESDVFRGMGLFTNTLNNNGRFRFDLDPGSYVVVARQRLSDETSMGPLKRGDLFCYPSANPVRIETSSSCELQIPCYPRDDLVEYLNEGGEDPRGKREESRSDASLRDTVMLDNALGPGDIARRQTVISGRVTDLAGQPKPGLFVQAYSAADHPLFQMYIVRLITDHMTRTDENGSFRIEVDRPGEYYIIAREVVGEAPKRNEFYGLYEKNANHSIKIEKGKVTAGVDITVEKIMTAN